jgi:hypothetical protein
MENKRMSYEVNQTRIYKDAYRPSSNLSRFFKAVWSIILVGDSPISKPSYQYKKTKVAQLLLLSAGTYL